MRCTSLCAHAMQFCLAQEGRHCGLGIRVRMGGERVRRSGLVPSPDLFDLGEALEPLCAFVSPSINEG